MNFMFIQYNIIIRVQCKYASINIPNQTAICLCKCKQLKIIHVIFIINSINQRIIN